MDDDCSQKQAAQIAELRARLDGLTKLVDVRWEYTEKAVDLAAKAMTIRLDHANGLIAMLKEQTGKFALNENMKAMELKMSNWEGRLLVLSGLAAMVGSAIGSIATYLMK